MTGLTTSRVLLVDDEPSIRRALRAVLLERGFEVVEASRGEEAIHLLRAGKYDVVLLDINMPGIGGIATLRRVRTLLPRIPVIVVSVRDDEEDKIAAFDLGANDYVTKPFSTGELIARIRSVIRRAQEAVSLADGPRIIGEIQVVPSKRKMTKAGQPIHLTRKEFDIVYYLIKGAGRVVTHREILTAVWGAEYRAANDCLRTFVRQIRKKIEDDPSNPRYLLTHAYVGYTFNDSPTAGSESG